MHLFVRPEAGERFVALFRDVLGCGGVERDIGLAHPIVFVPFAYGSGFSVEFTQSAPENPPRPTTTVRFEEPGSSSGRTTSPRRTEDGARPASGSFATLVARSESGSNTLIARDGRQNVTFGFASYGAFGPTTNRCLSR